MNTNNRDTLNNMNRLRIRTRAILVPLVVVAGLAVIPSATAQDGFASEVAATTVAQDDDFAYSLNLSSFDSFTPDELDTILSMAHTAGATTIHTGAVWWWLNGGGPGQYDWSHLDALITAAARYDLDVILQLTGTPDWVHPDLAASVPEFTDRIWYPPVGSQQELGDWATFVRDVVSRYGVSVRGYEIWNEPNLDTFWKPVPNPSAYAELLRVAYLTAKETNNEAVVLFGGTSSNDVGFLRAFYEGAAVYPDAASEQFFFDVLAVHPYSRDRSPTVIDSQAVYEGRFGEIDENFLGFRKMKSEMDASGDTSKKIFLTEYGFSTTQTWMPPVPEETRAQYLKEAFELATQHDYIIGLSWYLFVELQPFEEAWAMLNRDFSGGATFDAFAETAPAPTTGPDGFLDDEGSPFELDITWLAEQGITKGCNPPANTLFCPDQYVTRAQMAAFLVRALGYTDDDGGDHFSDANGSAFELDIDRLRTAGVTKGCNPPANTLFCPDQYVTRAQMAAFLHRALE